MLKQCCSAVFWVSLIVPVAWAQDKPAAPGASKPQAAKPKASSAKTQKQAAEPQKGSVAETDSAGVKAIEEIFACVAQG